MTVAASATAWRGDPAAFAALYDMHFPAAYRLAIGVVRNGAAAEDVVQEAFLALWRTETYSPQAGPVRHYLLRIVRNCAIDRLRRDSRQLLAQEPEQDTGAEDPAIERHEMVQIVRDAMRGLPAPQRQALELAYYDDLSQAEIATHLGAPLGTVKSRIRLGLRKLGSGLDPADVR